MTNQERKIKKIPLTFIVIGLVLVLSLTQLLIAHRLATTGEVVKKFEIKAAEIEQENAFLKEGISQTGSLSEVFQKAEELGLVRTSSILYLTSQIPVALGH